MYAYRLYVCIWSGVYVVWVNCVCAYGVVCMHMGCVCAYGVVCMHMGGVVCVHMEVCVYMHHLAGQKFLMFLWRSSFLSGHQLILCAAVVGTAELVPSYQTG